MSQKTIPNGVGISTFASERPRRDGENDIFLNPASSIESPVSAFGNELCCLIRLGGLLFGCGFGFGRSLGIAASGIFLHIGNRALGAAGIFLFGHRNLL